MKWDGGEESANVEDRRGDDGGGGGGMTPTHLSLGAGGTLVIMLLGYFLGIDPRMLGQITGSGGGMSSQPVSRAPSAHVAPAQHDRAQHFIKTILRYTEVVWAEQFASKLGKKYVNPKLVMYGGQTQTGCGPGTTAMGPFYCPADQTVYIDPNFYEELEGQLGGSKADFSQAYVIAHEIGHHVQNLLGFSEIVDEKRRTLSKTEFNKWSVRLELQADYLAGVWAHYGDEKYHFIEKGDAEEAIKSANAIGDDRLQKRATGHTSPQNYTHGTAAQRVKWYSKGLQTGDFSQLQVIFDLPYEQL